MFYELSILWYKDAKADLFYYKIAMHLFVICVIQFQWHDSCNVDDDDNDEKYI